MRGRAWVRTFQKLFSQSKEEARLPAEKKFTLKPLFFSITKFIRIFSLLVFLLLLFITTKFDVFAKLRKTVGFKLQI